MRIYLQWLAIIYNDLTNRARRTESFDSVFHTVRRYFNYWKDIDRDKGTVNGYDVAALSEIYKIIDSLLFLSRVFVIDIIKYHSREFLNPNTFFMSLLFIASIIIEETSLLTGDCGDIDSRLQLQRGSDIRLENASSYILVAQHGKYFFT